MRLARGGVSLAMLGVLALPPAGVEHLEHTALAANYLTLTPGHGSAGTTVTATGRCLFVAGDPIFTKDELTLYWDSMTGQRLVTARLAADPENPDYERFTASFRVPANAAPGPHRVVTGCTGQTPFVVDQPAPKPRLAVRPTQARPGGAITVTAEAVPFTLCRDSYRLLLGSRPAATGPLTATGGRLELPATVPGTASPGGQPIELQCPAGKPIASTPFEVLRLPIIPSTSRLQPTSTTAAPASASASGGALSSGRGSESSSTGLPLALAIATAALAAGAVVSGLLLRGGGQRWVSAHVQVRARPGRRAGLAFRTRQGPSSPNVTVRLRLTSDSGSRELREVRVERH